MAFFFFLNNKKLPGYSINQLTTTFKNTGSLGLFYGDFYLFVVCLACRQKPVIKEEVEERFSVGEKSLCNGFWSIL